MLAYERSTAMGGQVIDVDVRVSGDGVLIAFHDLTLQRTTNGTGRVDQIPYADLSKLDAGYDFTLGGKHPFRGKNVHIPTLESILKKFPHMLVTNDVSPASRAARIALRSADVPDVRTVGQILRNSSTWALLSVPR